MKKFGWNEIEFPDDSFGHWHQEADDQGRRYNSAELSQGCSCCKKHGADCPGKRRRGHHIKEGETECDGRCPTGFRKCRSSSTANQEYVVWNPERIDRIEIIDGPPSLVGLGQVRLSIDFQCISAGLRLVCDCFGSVLTHRTTGSMKTARRWLHSNAVSSVRSRDRVRHLRG